MVDNWDWTTYQTEIVLDHIFHMCARYAVARNNSHFTCFYPIEAHDVNILDCVPEYGAPGEEYTARKFSTNLISILSKVLSSAFLKLLSSSINKYFP